MSDESNIIEIDGDKYKKPGTINPNKKVNPKDFNLKKDGIRWGVVAGIGMALFLLAAQLTTIGDAVILKFLKYIVLGGVLLFGLNIQKSYLRDSYQFQNGIRLGAIITALSAVTLAVMNMIIYWIFEHFTFDKYSIEAYSVENTAILSGVLLFEALVFGMILTFIILQIIKSKTKNKY